MIKKYIVLYGDNTQEDYTVFKDPREALDYARDIKSYTPRATLLKDYHIQVYSTTAAEVDDMDGWSLEADLNSSTLDRFMEEVNYTVYEAATLDMDIVLRSGEVVSIPLEDMDEYINGDDFTREGYAYIYSHYKHYFKY